MNDAGLLGLRTHALRVLQTRSIDLLADGGFPALYTLTKAQAIEFEAEAELEFAIALMLAILVEDSHWPPLVAGDRIRDWIRDIAASMRSSRLDPTELHFKAPGFVLEALDHRNAAAGLMSPDNRVYDLLLGVLCRDSFLVSVFGAVAGIRN